MSEKSLAAILVALSLDAGDRADLVDARTRQCLVDWLGVVFAASPGHPVVQLRQSAQLGSSSDVLSGAKRGAADAAFANAFHAHQYDFDDFHLDVPGHASAPVIGAAFAVAEEQGKSFGDLMRAVVAGVEAIALLGRAYGDQLFLKGWHPTSIFGSIGAAVAASSLLNLNEIETQNSVGLAALQSSGSMAGFGSIGKPWQVGASARNGVQAALASRSVQHLLPNYLDGPHGVLTLMTESSPTLPLEKSKIPRIQTTQFKYFSTCFGTHAAVRAAVRLQEEYELSEGEIAELSIGIGADFAHVVFNPNPKNELAAKFSVSTAVALTLIGKSPSEPKFFPVELQNDPRYLRLEKLAITKLDPELVGGGARVVLKLRDGRYLEHLEVESAAPEPEMEMAAVQQKFLGLVAPVRGELRAQQLFDWLASAGVESPIAEFSNLVTR